MKITALPSHKRQCPYCGNLNGLAYYHEDAKKADLYYCTSCYRVGSWNGRFIEHTEIEAYPNRDKSTD